ncbi:MAG: hypothetical protein J6C28_02795 [Bacilli bacterium]|nr:hypothetical protein [Bacilli bacterium]
MNLKQIVKTFMIFIVISFLSLYITSTSGYYEYNLKQKNILTDEAIERFEKDVKEGKKIIASNYIEEKKDYNNKSSEITLKLSNFISKTFDKIMKYIFKKIESTVNS